MQLARNDSEEFSSFLFLRLAFLPPLSSLRFLRRRHPFLFAHSSFVRLTPPSPLTSFAVDLSEGGRLYYFNHLTGDRSWEKPKIFFMFLNMGPEIDLDDPHPWSIEYTPDGKQIWFNRDSGDMIEGTDDGFGTEYPPEKPPGYPICQNCTRASRASV